MTSQSIKQFSLFDKEPISSPRSTTALTPEELALAKALPANIRFGTSSWTYRGWEGLIYQRRYASEREFNRESLAEYAMFPWFRTVGIDSAFYAPLDPETLLRFSQQLRPDMVWVSKVWEEVTIPRYAKHPRYGQKAGKPNPNFLNAELFTEAVLGPYDRPEIIGHTGPFVFQFQTLDTTVKRDPTAFLEPLDIFLGKLPRTFRYAIEVRNKALLIPEYFNVLNRHGATHCFNHWTNMPSLREQMFSAANAGGLAAKFFVCRILTPHGITYEQAVERFRPYDRIQLVNEEMREDVVTLCRRAVKRDIEAFVLVNNRAEGSSPETVREIGRRLMAKLAEEHGTKPPESTD